MLDEVLAVGDEAFQRKCNDFFENIKKDKTKTVILVTHSMADVKKYCNNAIFIADERDMNLGDVDKVVEKYIASNLDTLNSRNNHSSTNDNSSSFN